jgi:Leucine-rich repeat (LRR) protein
LWLDANTITGTIPTEIGLCTGLASLSMTNSTLSGSIPDEFGNLVELRRLWLYNNQLTGDIPEAFNKLPKLEVVELHHNKFSGEMPSGVCSAIQASEYEFKSLTSDCINEVSCSNECCTECF